MSTTILEITNANKSLSTLVKGIKAAGLEETLSGFGPFTIFAPVNLAFSNMGSVTFDDLVKPSNKLKLSELLTFHVIAGKSLIDDLHNGQKLKTVNGQELSVTINGSDVHINGAKILAKNMQGTNGVVHTMSAVNIPQ
ncbi:MAG: fasciclin domain-containing protein [Chitinophagaceae bacterium]